MSASNPFATRFTRPGAIEYLFPPGESLPSLIARLQEQDWWGEIIGPHGSGKSTLLATLVPALTNAGRRVVWRAIRREGLGTADSGLAGQKSEQPKIVDAKFVSVTAGSDGWNETTQLVLDGYEQLSWWWRRRVQALVRRRGAGLLVAAHEPLGLPALAMIKPSEAVAHQVVEKLIARDRAAVTSAEVSRAFAASGQNLRETLFALYDVYQSRRP